MVKRSPLTLAGAMVLLLVAPEGVSHPIHTTFTEIVQGDGDRISVTVRGFADDLTTVARIVTPGGALDSAIETYLRRKVQLRDGRNRPVALMFQHVRRSGDVVWFAFLGTTATRLDDLTLVNSALTELYGDQVNVVQIKVGGRSRTLLFTPGDGAKSLGR